MDSSTLSRLKVCALQPTDLFCNILQLLHSKGAAGKERFHSLGWCSDPRMVDVSPTDTLQVCQEQRFAESLTVWFLPSFVPTRCQIVALLQRFILFALLPEQRWGGNQNYQVTRVLPDHPHVRGQWSKLPDMCTKLSKEKRLEHTQLWKPALATL